MAGIDVPGLRGYLAGQQENRQGDQANLGMLSGILQLQNQIEQQQQSREMRPLQLAQLQAAVEDAKAKGILRQRTAAFNTPENLAQFQTGGTPAQSVPVPVPGLEGVTLPATPGRLDPQRLLQGAAAAGLVDPMTYAKEQITENKPQFAPSRSPGYFQNGQWVATPENRASDQTPVAKLLAEKAALPPDDPRHAIYAQAITHATNPQQQRIIIPPQPHYITTTEGIGTAGPGGVFKPVLNDKGQPVMPPSAARIDFTAANQLQGQFNRATNSARDELGLISGYQNARASGDNAQAATVAAANLRRVVRSGNAGLMKDVDAILGSGYRGGSVTERAESFISQELMGSPSDRVLKRLDGLMDTQETSILQKIGGHAQNVSNQASARKLPVQHVVTPFIRGSKVVFPEGKVIQFSNTADAEAAAQKWYEAHQPQQ